MDSKEIKTFLIDYLIDKNQNTNIIIGNEVMYGFKKNHVDILMLSRNKCIAYEIKADNDDFRRLPSQLLIYKQVFDYIYIVTTERHINKCMEYDNSIGIILIHNTGKIKILRKANIQQNNKYEIAETINMKFLKQYFHLSLLSSSEIRELVRKQSLRVIKRALFAYWAQILSARYNMFKGEIGDHVLVDDLALLSLYSRIIF